MLCYAKKFVYLKLGFEECEKFVYLKHRFEEQKLFVYLKLGFQEPKKFVYLKLGFQESKKFVYLKLGFEECKKSLCIYNWLSKSSKVKTANFQTQFSLLKIDYFLIKFTSKIALGLGA